MEPSAQLIPHLICLSRCFSGIPNYCYVIMDHSNMQCESAEHWGDNKSDLVPLGSPRAARQALMSCLDFCQTGIFSEREEWEERNVISLYHKLHCETQSGMSSVRCELFMWSVEQHSSCLSFSLSLYFKTTCFLLCTKPKTQNLH